MAIIKSEKEVTRIIDTDGKEQTTTKEKTSKVERSGETDYIKLYTKMWCEFNEIPNAYRNLFIELATRMSYANINADEGGQLVSINKPYNISIMNALGWKKAMFQRGLKALCECNAIRRIARGVYQINPQYAGRGEWKYNPKLERGGVEDLIAKFSFKDKTVEITTIWADNGKNTLLNNTYRDGLNVKSTDNATLKTMTKTPKAPIETAIDDELSDMPELDEDEVDEYEVDWLEEDEVEDEDELEEDK